MESATKGTGAGGVRGAEPVQLKAGVECMLHVTGRHFLAKILDVNNDVVHVSFPGKDYPIEGMRGALEFHDDEGFFYYAIQVVHGPVRKGSGIVLRRIAGLKRSKHRDACRVPTDLTVQVKDEAHVRRYNAALLNISGGGALVETEAPFDYSTTAELTISLPGEASHNIRCQVVDVLASCNSVHSTGHRYCLRFVEIEPDAEKCITRYVWERLHQLYPPE